MHKFMQMLPLAIVYMVLTSHIISSQVIITWVKEWQRNQQRRLIRQLQHSRVLVFHHSKDSHRVLFGFGFRMNSMYPIMSLILIHFALCLLKIRNCHNHMFQPTTTWYVASSIKKFIICLEIYEVLWCSPWGHFGKDQQYKDHVVKLLENQLV